MNRPRCRTPRCLLLLAGLLALLAAPSIATGDDHRFPASRDSVRGRFHRMALVPPTYSYAAGRKDSVLAAFESLTVARLTGAGFEVVDPEIGLGIGRRLVDSLGGLYSPSTGEVDSARAREVRERVLAELAGVHGADGFVYWRLVKVPAAFSSGKAEWDGTKETIEKRGFLSKTMGLQYSGKVPAWSLEVILDDRTGRTLYWDRAGIACAATLQKGKFVERPREEIFGDAERNSDAVKRALEHFFEEAAKK